VNRRAATAGVLVAIVYVAVVAITVAIRTGHVRPLYDGFAPPSQYQWVDPPSFFAAGNTRPKGASATVALGPTGSVAAGFGSPDGQFVIDLPRDAIPPRAGEDHAVLTITPLSSSRFAPLPSGLRPNGNVYRLAMHYAKSGVPVDELAKPGTVLVEIPEVGTDMFRAQGEHAWYRVPSTALGSRQLSVSATFARTGDYVSGTALPELVASSTRSRNWWLIGGGTALAAAVLFAGSVLLARRGARRGHRPAP
jgi:hypothetical protein